MSSMRKKYEDMTIEELQKELARLKENLCDIEDQHSFTFGKTTVHIGAEQAQNMQEEYEQECREHAENIAKVETMLKARGAL
jgi:ribosomal protein L29